MSKATERACKKRLRNPRTKEFDRSEAPRRARAYASSTDTGELLALDMETGSFHEGACPGGRYRTSPLTLSTPEQSIIPCC